MQPTSDGLNSSTVCQPSVIMLCLPSQCEDTSTIGPGSRYRRTLLTGKSDFTCRFMVSHEQCAGYSGAVNGFRIILRSSGAAGPSPCSGSAPSAAWRIQTEDGGDLFTARASELASGPQKI